MTIRYNLNHLKTAAFICLTSASALAQSQPVLTTQQKYVLTGLDAETAAMALWPGNLGLGRSWVSGN